MTLDKINIRPYLKYLFPNKPDAAINDMSTRWIQESENQERDLSTHYIATDSSGKIQTTLRTESDSEKNYRIILPTSVINSESIPSHALLSLVNEAVSVLKKKGALKISFRVVENLNLNFLSKELPDLGFSLKNTRVEYQSEVCDLPAQKKNSPFTWVNVLEGTTYDLKYAARMLEKAGDGNPEWGSWEQNIEVLHEYLDDREFIADPKNLQIGFIGDKTSAVILTQVAKTGWCTIAYMGLLPAFRGAELGQWVHQKGFEIMRALGGIRYHGGTDSENKGMRALFEKHRCEEFRSMQEWECAF